MVARAGPDFLASLMRSTVVSVSEIETAFWEMIRKSAGKYPPHAFHFVQEGLRHTAEHLGHSATEHGGVNSDSLGESSDDSDLIPGGGRHMNGQQLCLGLRDYAVLQFGLLARTVLDRWNIRRTEDFGRIVFLLVDAGLLRKTDEDSIEDFAGVYDFDEVFGRELERC